MFAAAEAKEVSSKGSRGWGGRTSSMTSVRRWGIRFLGVSHLVPARCPKEPQVVPFFPQKNAAKYNGKRLQKIEPPEDLGWVLFVYVYLQ